MHRKHLLWLLGIVAIVSLWWASSPPDGRGPGAVGPSARENRSGAEASTASSLEQSAAREGVEGRPSMEGDGAPAGSSAHIALETPFPSYTIVVVDAAGDPVAGALVMRGHDDFSWLVEAAQLSPDTTFEDLDGGRERIRNRPWMLHQTDAHGRVALQDEGAPIRVLAGHDGAWGAALVPATAARGESHAEVRLEAPMGFDVRVTDPSGRQLDVGGVGLAEPARTQLHIAQRNLAGHTVPLARPVLTTFASAGYVQVFAGAALGTVAGRVDLPQGLGTTHTLVVANGTRLIVHANDMSGGPIDVDGGSFMPSVMAAMGNWPAARFVGGTLRLDGLVPHTSVEGTIRLPGYGQQYIDVSLAGPGEEVEVVVSLQTLESVVLTGQLLLPSGVEASTLDLRANIQVNAPTGSTPASTVREVPLSLDASARFREGFEISAFPDGSTFEVGFNASGQRPGGPGHRVEQVWTDVVVEGGVIDLGSLVVEPLPVLLAGRVVDGRGEGVPACEVGLVLRTQFELDGGQAASSRAVHWLEVTTDAAGRFAFGGDPPANTRALEVVLTAPGLVQTWPRQEFEPGTENAEVLAQAAGVLAGNLTGQDSTGRRRFVVELVPMGWRADSHPSGSLAGSPDFWDAMASRDVAADGTFGWNAVPEGAYVLVVRGGGKELVRIENLLVRAGEICDDPRLVNIDPYPGSFTMRLDIVDAKGRPADRGYVYEYVGARWELMARLEFGGARWTATELPGELLVASKEQGAKRFTPTAASEHIVLDAPIELQVPIPSADELAAQLDEVWGQPLFVLYAQLEDPEFRTSPGIEWRRDLRYAQPGRTMSLQLAKPGRYRVGVGHDAGSGASTAPWLPLFETVVDVTADRRVELAPEAGDDE